MLLWEELPSAQAANVQAIFLYDERCRLAGDLVQVSANEAAHLFAFRPAPTVDLPPPADRSAATAADPNTRMTLIASDMTNGLRLIYTAAPLRLRHLASRAREQGGVLTRRAREATMPLPNLRAGMARVRLLLRQARGDTARLSNALARADERFDESNSSIAASTAVWRMGVALSTLLQSGREVDLEVLIGNVDPQRAEEATSVITLARSVVRPGDWSNRMPVNFTDLPVFSGEIGEHFAESLNRIVAEMRGTGLADPAIRSLLDRRRVPSWLIGQVLRDNPSPWRRQ